MNNSQYRGVVVPMVTPVTQDGRLDTEAVQRIIDFFALARLTDSCLWKRLSKLPTDES